MSIKRKLGAIVAAFIVFWVCVFWLYGYDYFSVDSGGVYQTLSGTGTVISAAFALLVHELISHGSKRIILLTKKILMQIKKQTTVAVIIEIWLGVMAVLAIGFYFIAR